MLPGQPPRYEPPRGGSEGGGWKALLIIGFLLLIVTIVIKAGSGLRVGRSHGASAKLQKDFGLEEVVLKESDSDQKIAILEINGVISSEPWDHRGKGIVELIGDQLDRCAQDEDVKAVVLKIDSPGGEVLPADEVSRLLERFQKDHSIPVVASMGSVAASGGYYVAAPCQWIVANELTITGSIGVIMHGYNYRSLMDKVGVRPQVYKSGKFKDMMSSEKLEAEITAEETGMVQAMIQETFDKFKEVVRTGREQAKKKNKQDGRALVSSWVEMADGRILTGRQAFEGGFVDELGNFEVAVERAKTLAGIEEATLVGYQAPYGFSSLFKLLGERSASASLKIDLGFEAPKIKAGRPYLLWLP